MHLVGNKYLSARMNGTVAPCFLPLRVAPCSYPHCLLPYLSPLPSFLSQIEVGCKRTRENEGSLEHAGRTSAAAGPFFQAVPLICGPFSTRQAGPLRGRVKGPPCDPPAPHNFFFIALPGPLRGSSMSRLCLLGRPECFSFVWKSEASFYYNGS